MSLDAAWEVMQLPEFVTAEELLSVAGKTKPIVPLYSHAWARGVGEGFLLEEEDDKGEEEEDEEKGAGGEESEGAFLASWAAAHPQVDSVFLGGHKIVIIVIYFSFLK